MDVPYKRVLIVGCGGSGKSTLARHLGEKTGLPVVHLDRLWWLPGWVERSREDSGVPYRIFATRRAAYDWFGLDGKEIERESLHHG